MQPCTKSAQNHATQLQTVPLSYAVRAAVSLEADPFKQLESSVASQQQQTVAMIQSSGEKGSTLTLEVVYADDLRKPAAFPEVSPHTSPSDSGSRLAHILAIKK